jgi:putative ABC transport system permease protein
MDRYFRRRRRPAFRAATASAESDVYGGGGAVAGLGIGANTAIFQLIDAIRLRTLPVGIRRNWPISISRKDRTAVGWWSTRSANFTSKQWDSVRTQQQAFSGMIAWSAKPFNLAQEGKARYAEGLFVSGDFFNVLQGAAGVGRVFSAQDDQPGCGSPGAVIGYSFWQGEFGGDPAVTNRTSGWMAGCSR